MYSSYTESAAQIAERKARILASMPKAKATQTENQIVAASLAARAIRAVSQSESELYILAAIKKDPTIDGDALRTIWTERWLRANASRGGDHDG